MYIKVERPAKYRLPTCHINEHLGHRIFQSNGNMDMVNFRHGEISQAQTLPTPGKVAICSNCVSSTIIVPSNHCEGGERGRSESPRRRSLSRDSNPYIISTVLGWNRSGGEQAWAHTCRLALDESNVNNVDANYCQKKSTVPGREDPTIHTGTGLAEVWRKK